MSLNKSPCLGAALGINIFIIVTERILVIICLRLKSDLDVQQTHLRGRFVEHSSQQKEQEHQQQQQQQHRKQQQQQQQRVTKIISMKSMILVTLCCTV